MGKQTPLQETITTTTISHPSLSHLPPSAGIVERDKGAELERRRRARGDDLLSLAANCRRSKQVNSLPRRRRSVTKWRQPERTNAEADN